VPDGLRGLWRDGREDLARVAVREVGDEMGQGLRSGPVKPGDRRGEQERVPATSRQVHIGPVDPVRPEPPREPSQTEPVEGRPGPDGHALDREGAAVEIELDLPDPRDPLPGQVDDLGVENVALEKELVLAEASRLQPCSFDDKRAGAKVAHEAGLHFAHASVPSDAKADDCRMGALEAHDEVAHAPE
jgi:hypothetical protein